MRTAFLLAASCLLLPSCSAVGWLLIDTEMRLKGGEPRPLFYRYK